jgi:hypothetical protein
MCPYSPTVIQFGSARIIVVPGWSEEVKRRVPKP